MTFVRCRCCRGTGWVRLNGVYADTLALLPRGREVTAASLAPAAGCTGRAMSNRLAALEQMGLLSSRRYGRVRLFRKED